MHKYFTRFFVLIVFCWDWKSLNGLRKYRKKKNHQKCKNLQLLFLFWKWFSMQMQTHVLTCTHEGRVSFICENNGATSGDRGWERLEEQCREEEGGGSLVGELVSGWSLTSFKICDQRNCLDVHPALLGKGPSTVLFLNIPHGSLRARGISIFFRKWRNTDASSTRCHWCDPK